MLVRALSGAVYVALIILSLILGNVPFALFCAIIIYFGFDEYFAIMKKMKIKVDMALPTAFALASFALLVFAKNGLLPVSWLFISLLFMIVLMITQFKIKDRNPVFNITSIAFSFVYILIPVSTLYLIGFYDRYSWSDSFQYEVLLGFFALNWASDTGAYLAGNAFGKHKLFERLSPKKTIEGSVGGLILTIAVSYALSIYVEQVAMLDWILIAIIVVFFGTSGDLFESMIKRKAEVKDSGKIIPGHGGVLDRLDSILFSAPVVFVYLNLVSG